MTDSGSKQSEKKGRFLIQEIDDDNYLSQKDNYMSEKMLNLLTNNNPPHNNSKRPKHSSIVMDSKIIHTTRTDSNFSSIMFATFIYDENRKDWVDFDHIWKKFSKRHVDILEDDMEKIFHYISDNSDFFYFNNCSHYNNGHEIYKCKSEEKMKILDKKGTQLTNEINLKNHFEKNILDNNQQYKIILNQTESTLHNNMPLKKTKRAIKFDSMNEENQETNCINKSLMLTNICDASSISSPAISPINGSSKIISFEKNTENYTRHKNDINQVQNNFLKTINCNKHSYFKSPEQKNCFQYDFHIIKATSFALNSIKNSIFKSNQLQIDGRIQEDYMIREENWINNSRKKCAMCKNKI